MNFSDILKGLSQLIHTSGCLQLFFSLHDSDGDGRLTKQDTITLSETFLFLFRKLEGDAPLGSVSSFLNRAFMVPVKDESQTDWYLDFSTYQEMIMADDFLVEYLATFPSTFVLLDIKSGVYTTMKVTAVREIADSLFGGGFRWVSEKWTGVNGKNGKAAATTTTSPGVEEKAVEREKVQTDKDLLDEGSLLTLLFIVDDLLRDAGLEEMN